MSRTDNTNLHVKRKHLSGKDSKDGSGISLKASKAASIKHVRSQSAAGAKDSSVSKAVKEESRTEPVSSRKITFVDTDDIREETSTQKDVTISEKKEEKDIDLIWSSEEMQEPSSPRKIKWTLLIPAIVVVLGILFFTAASYAGWIQSFLTPEDRLVKNMTTPEETTPVPTTTEPPTTTTETTTEETTTEFIPSYYVINVNLAYNIVTVYTRGEKLNDGYDPKDPLDDEYDLIPEIAFTCSPGVDGATPTGTYYLENRALWCLMIGDVYTQYATRIVDDVMFHSVPYYKKDPGTLETDQYNILGYEASSACIRLNVRDAAWIFNYCAEGTEVNIYYNWDYYGPLDPEPIYRIPEDIPQLAGWDPTDIYSAGNPWFSYSAGVNNDHVSLPCYSSVESLVNAIGPVDEYGNSLHNHFYTDGGYNLDYPGTYTTTGHIQVGDLSFSFPITITITEDIAEEYYEYYNDDYSDYDDYDDWDYTENDEYDWDDQEEDSGDNDWEYSDDYDNSDEVYDEEYSDDTADDYDGEYSDDTADDYDGEYSDDTADDYDGEYSDDTADDYDGEYSEDTYEEEVYEDADWEE